MKNEISSNLTIETKMNSVSIERLDSGSANYDDLVDAFARELTADEISLISGAVKIGTYYCGGVGYVGC
ncbi:hypothetical protein MKL42_01350 [Acinetobacter sp. AOR15_HL]|uniref:hypothetical protein n=1 Tax=unclassified Acinetobacter TaxID=196816 RepID=UPI0022EACAF0|nr:MULTISPECIES: hypothetical protein [unclassified Acinetobacter]MDA3556165.1 hypothetical protein [Acinetobacter sp. AOR15_HL]MDA3571622.1 hypothetical protein [Acinetobacter sp. AOR14_HL]